MKRIGLVLTLVFGLPGLVALSIGIFEFRYTLSFRARSLPAEGVVVSLATSTNSKGSTLYKPVVEWTAADGKARRFTGSVASSPPSYEVGDKVRLRYATAEPEDARIEGFLENWFVPLLLGLLGTLFTGLGAAFGLQAWSRFRRIRWLRAHGTKVQATFSGVQMDTSFKVNGRHPWILIARWQNPADGISYAFRSDSLWFDPSEFVKTDTLEVLIDPKQPERHYVDLSFLPEKGR